MRHSNIIRALLILKWREKKTSTLWDTAEPISLEAIRAELAALARAHLADIHDPVAKESATLSLEELWRIFESLEELDDGQVIY